MNKAPQRRRLLYVVERKVPYENTALLNFFGSRMLFVRKVTSFDTESKLWPTRLCGEQGTYWRRVSVIRKHFWVTDVMATYPWRHFVPMLHEAQPSQHIVPTKVW